MLEGRRRRLLRIDEAERGTGALGEGRRDHWATEERGGKTTTVEGEER